MATTPETTEDFHLFKEKPLTWEIRKVEASRMREIDTSCRVIDKMVAVSSVNPWDAGIRIRSSSKLEVRPYSCNSQQ